MTTDAINLITVSRQFGAGGSDFARELGALLGWPVLDKDIVHRVAERLRMEDEIVERYDEHSPSLIARIATVLIVPQPDMYSFPPPDSGPSHDQIAEATTTVIEEAASSLPLIVVGHGAQCIFHQRSGSLHVRVTAPAARRTRNVIIRMGVQPSVAAMLVRRADEDRQAYVRRYFHHDWRDETLYDVHVNTERITLREAAEMTSALVAARQGMTQRGTGA